MKTHADESVSMVLPEMAEVESFHGDDGKEMALRFTATNGQQLTVKVPRCAIEPMVAMLEKGARVLDERKQD